MTATRFKFTAPGIQSKANTPHPERVDYRDTLTRGLQFRIGPRGAAFYYLRRIDGRLVRLKLGDWPATTLQVARARAGDMDTIIEQCRHPQAEQARRKADKSESRRRDHARLVERLAADWRAAHFPSLAASTRRDYDRLLSEFVEAFAGRDIATIRRGEIIRHLDCMKARSGAQANRAAVVVRQLFAYALDWLDLPANPASEIKNPARQTRRRRVLDRAEIRVLWRACELAGYPRGHALRFALCTGQRIGEIGAMKRTDIEGDYWTNAATKTGQRIDIYLADHARAILDESPRIGDHVFTATGRAGLRSDTWGGSSGALARHIHPRIEDAARELGVDPIVEHFTAHDLRRTVRTGLTGWAAVLPDTAERVLNHSMGGLRAIYDHADYRPHVAEALRLWDAELGRILAGKAVKVTPIRRGMARA